LDTRSINFPKFLIFELHASHNSPLTNFVRIYERKALDHGLGINKNQGNSELPALVYVHLQGYLSALKDTEGKSKLDAATAAKSHVREVITSIDVFVSATASLPLRRFAEIVC
jgi:hypothetical protein